MEEKEYWKNGMVEEWKIGRIEEKEEWNDGRKEKYKIGMMEYWKNEKKVASYRLTSND